MRNLLLVLLLVLVGITAHAQDSVSISCSQNDCYITNNNEGDLTIGPKGAHDLKLCTDQDASATCVTVSGTGVLELPGDIQSDATNLGLDAASGANTACDTTCAVADGACVFGFDAGTTALVDCASALADTCICAEPVA